MAQVGLIKTTWQGTSGGPGLTQMAITSPTGDPITNSQAQSAVNAVRAFWAAVNGLIPNEVTLTVLPTVDMYEAFASNNQLSNSMVVPTPPATVTGLDTGVYAMAAGLKVNLHTSVVRFGRRVRGCFYIVPAGATAYTNLGTVAAAARTTINTAGATLSSSLATAGLNLVVWTRYNEVKHPERTSWLSIVDSVTANETTAILRGRRD